MKHILKILVIVVVAGVVLLGLYIVIPRVYFSYKFGSELKEYKKNVFECVDTNVLAVNDQPSDEVICGCFSKYQDIIGETYGGGLGGLNNGEHKQSCVLGRCDYKNEELRDAYKFRVGIYERIMSKFDINSKYTINCIGTDILENDGF